MCPPGASTRSALPPAIFTRLAKCSTPGLSASLSPTSRRTGPDCPLSRAAIASSPGPTAGLWPPTPEKTPGCIATREERDPARPVRSPDRAIGRVGESAVGLVRPRHEVIDEIGGQRVRHRGSAVGHHHDHRRDRTARDELVGCGRQADRGPLRRIRAGAVQQEHDGEAALGLARITGGQVHAREARSLWAEGRLHLLDGAGAGAVRRDGCDAGRRRRDGCTRRWTRRSWAQSGRSPRGRPHRRTSRTRRPETPRVPRPAWLDRTARTVSRW